MDLVSVIIPIYNSEETIKKCIESITKQTYKQLEILCINDGSTDSTLNILNKYSKNEKRIKIINQDNSGVSIARNNGIQQSTGEYIIFVDSDDWLELNYVEKMVNAIKKEKVDVVRCSYYKEYKTYSEKENMFELSNKKLTGKEINKTNVQNHFLYNKQSINNYIVLLIIKSSIIKNTIEFDKDLYMMEDALFYQQLFHNINSIFFYDNALYHVNKSNISATRDITKIEKNLIGILETSKKISSFLEKEKIEFFSKKLNSCHLNIIIFYLEKILKQKELKNILTKLYENDKFIIMLNNLEISYFKKYRRTLVYFLKKHYINLTIFLFKIKKIIRK